MKKSILHHYADRAASKRRTSYLTMSVLLLILIAFASLLVLPEASAEPLGKYAAVEFDPHEQVGHHHSSDNSRAEGITAGEILFFAARALYYFALMLASGMMLWSVVIPVDKDSIARRLLIKWEVYAMRLLLLAALLFVFTHITQLLKGYDGGNPNEWFRLLTETSTGQSWLAILVLSLLGFAVLRLTDSFKLIWALLLAAVESFNGHIMALPDNTLAVVLDFLHIVCSALWAGGLLLLLMFWRAERKEAGRFAERFTKIAWMTILVLTASGIGMVVLLLPAWQYLFYTSWGIMLLAKGVLVLLVACTGFLLHRRAKQGKLPNGKLLKLDGLLMAMVLIIVSIFTYLSPVPNTEPLSYHKMGDKLHYTIQIKPNGPGPNRINLKIWLPMQLGAPASVSLRLQAVDHPNRPAIEVPLRAASGEDYLSFPGFTETDYESEKVELSTRGKWEVELIIKDQSGAETKELISFRND
ncbi:hypothetical protein BK133_09880 [Paenibacillus sp. FSL H8-0548]|uniref:copper resistance D family protein n=1 Tax=Paenibacillus sp. FSL H8-0548 TaxID=1920422 RepID=UPI00096F1976|nr:CopD family protein [Paenibacillus sp. FSL H8-0548]OMF35984.1 hypothetical protein BK133_09880 [Paenibacillus sp. FSL H8-0548]